MTDKKREIKFRAWDKIEKKMMDWFFVHSEKGGVWEQDGMDKMIKYPEDRFILMQFTGLFDKNGKEIYEFDLVKHEDTGQVSVVEWSSGDWGWLMRSIKSWNPKAQFDSSTDEVIGNVYVSLRAFLAFRDEPLKVNKDL